MRRPLLLPLLLTLLVGLVLPACSGGEAEKAMAPFQGDGFSVRMPGKPERSSQTVPSAAGTLTLVLYTSESQKKAYSVGYTDLPSGIEVDLSQVTKGAAAAVKGTATEEADSTYQGLPARDSRITNASDAKGNKATVFLRVIKADRRLYQLQYLEKGEDVKAPPAVYGEFLSSFKIG